MVININRNEYSDMSFNEFFAVIEKELSDAIHEFQYDMLMDKYKYLQENGVVMEAEQAEGLKAKFKGLIDTFAKKVETAANYMKGKIDSFIAKIKGKANGSDVSSIVKKAESVESTIMEKKSNLITNCYNFFAKMKNADDDFTKGQELMSKGLDGFKSEGMSMINGLMNDPKALLNKSNEVVAVKSLQQNQNNGGNRQNSNNNGGGKKKHNKKH